MMLDADVQRVAWRDPDSAWWVKLRRADQHIVEAAGRLEVFTSDEPWTVEAKPGPGTGEQNYRLRVHRAVPADLLAVLGDAVHNLRSALDAMAYGLAEQHWGTLTPEQERVTRLPICRDEAAFDGFLDHRNRGIRPRDLYGDVQIQALRSVQPFAFASEAAAHGVEVSSDAEADMAADPAYRLDVLWNVDKHRRLAELDWFFGLAWWTGSGAGGGFHVPEGARLRDGTVVATFPAPPVGPEPSEITWEVGLSFADDRSRTTLSGSCAGGTPRSAAGSSPEPSPR